MTEKAEKNKSGAGKFFLGAAIGAAVGAIASKFIDVSITSDDEPDEELDELEESEKSEKTKAAKKPTVKKSSEKK